MEPEDDFLAWEAASRMFDGIDRRDGSPFRLAASKDVIGIVRPAAGKKGRGEESSGVFRVLRTFLLSLFSSFLAYDDS
jgi:hypothetical protein